MLDELTNESNVRDVRRISDRCIYYVATEITTECNWIKLIDKCSGSLKLIEGAPLNPELITIYQ